MVRLVAHLKNVGETEAKTDVELSVLENNGLFKVLCSVGVKNPSETVFDKLDLEGVRTVLESILTPFEPFKKRIFFAPDLFSYFEFLKIKKDIFV